MRGRTRPESGFTLVEVMVAMMLLGIALTVMYRGLASMNRTAVGATGRLVNLDEARVLMSTITKDLRTAARLTPESAPFTFAHEREVTFYANINTSEAPKKVHIYVDDDRRLVEEITDPEGVAPNYTYTSQAHVRVVGRFVANEGPIFSYVDTDGNCLGGQGGQPPCTMSGPLSSTDLLRISAIEVVISIRENGGPQPATLINRVRLPNVDYNPLIDTGG
jgi:prepilin-type N-terminal cleavage/methylation domain-containing protein